MDNVPQDRVPQDRVPHLSPAGRRVFLWSAALICAAVTGLAVPAAPDAAEQADAGAFALECDAGYVLVGITGRAERYVTRVSALCAPRSGHPDERESSARGGGDGKPFELRCAAGTIVTAVFGSRGNHIDKLELECRATTDGEPRGEPVFTDTAGGQGGEAFGPLRCGRNQSILGIKGKAGSVVDDVQVICSSDTAHPLAPDAWASRPAGGRDGVRFSLPCPDREVLVGASTRNGNWLDSLAAICVQVDDDGYWTGKPRVTDRVGGPGGTEVQRICPEGQAVAGMSGHARGLVDRLVLECRPSVSMRATRGAIAALQPAGGGGGDPFGPYRCPRDLPATGFQGAAGNYVDRIQLICGR
jgi:hypothetical protein